MVAYAFARAHPGEVSHLAVSGALLPGFGLERLLDFTRPRQGLPHLVFFAQPKIPARLIAGQERAFLGRFIGTPLPMPVLAVGGDRACRVPRRACGG